VTLALAATTIVVLVLLWELTLPKLRRWRATRRAAHLARVSRSQEIGYDPGRELRAEQRARELLRSCVNDEEWAMYRDLGFLRVWGGLGVDRTALGASQPTKGDCPSEPVSATRGAPYAYLVYPHEPIVAYLPQTGALLNEYCVAFPDHTRPYGSARLPDSDDVLAKWMALTADERRLIADANMHLPGRQIDPERVHRDLARLARWERERSERERRRPDSVSAQ
jgi:hypothetical protein